MPAIQPQSQKGWRTTFSTQTLVDRIGAGTNKALKEIAPQMEVEMKDFAPVDTGRLRGSIKVRAVQGKNPRIEITTVGYGFFVENGTVKMAPQPFVMPVVMKKKWPEQIAKIVRSMRKRGTEVEEVAEEITG